TQGAVYSQWQAFVPLNIATRRAALLHSPLLRRTAPIMRNGRHVANGADVDTGSRQSAHRALAARTRAGNPDFHRPQTAFTRLVSCGERRLVCGERGTLARSAEPERTGARPGDDVAFLVANRDDRVVERRLDVHDAVVDDALLLLLEALLLAACFCWCFRHDSLSLCLTGRLLLVCHRAAARTLAGAGVGVRPLAAHRQAAAMAQSAIRAHLDV